YHPRDCSPPKQRLFVVCLRWEHLNLLEGDRRTERNVAVAPLRERLCICPCALVVDRAVRTKSSGSSANHADLYKSGECGAQRSSELQRGAHHQSPCRRVESLSTRRLAARNWGSNVVSVVRGSKRMPMGFSPPSFMES